MTNGVTAGNATGQVVFSSPAGPFSTNTVSGGSATSSSLTNLPVGTDLITAAYSGGNYPGQRNTLNQVVVDPPAPGIAQANLPIYTDNLVNGFQNWSWATVESGKCFAGSFGQLIPSASPMAAAIRRLFLNIRILIPALTPV